MQKGRESHWMTLNNQGQRMFGVMHPPAKGDKAPAVIICHGFGGTKCGRHRLYVNLANKLAEQGIAALRFDYRGAGDSDGDFRDITVRGQESDTLVALDYLYSLPYVDRSRIGMLGSSFGGVISLLIAAKHKEIKSLVLWAPPYQVSEWLAMWEMFAAKMQGLSIEEQVIWFQAEPATASFVREFLTMPLKEQIGLVSHIPMLHFQGEKDEVVSPTHAGHYEECRQGAKALTRFVRLENSGHDFGDAKEQQVLIAESCDWFQKTL